MDLAHEAQAHMQGAAARGEELLRGASVFLRDAVRVDPQAASTASATAAEGRDQIFPRHAVHRFHTCYANTLSYCGCRSSSCCSGVATPTGSHLEPSLPPPSTPRRL